MSRRFQLRQAWTIATLQLRRVFFARRSLWVYVLALFPTLAFFGHGLEVSIRRAEWAEQITPAATMAAVREGATVEAVLERAGTPIRDSTIAAREFSDGRRRPERRYLQ